MSANNHNAYCVCHNNHTPDNHCSDCYREAADKIWDIALDYQAMGLWDLAQELKSLADHLHDLAREKLNTSNDDDSQ
jgi:hypothetical protein